MKNPKFEWRVVKIHVQHTTEIQRELEDLEGKGFEIHDIQTTQKGEVVIFAKRHLENQ